jgi:hypothetical protein
MLPAERSGGAPNLGAIFGNIGKAVHNTSSGVRSVQRRRSSGGGGGSSGGGSTFSRRRHSSGGGSSGGRGGVSHAGGGGSERITRAPSIPSLNSYLGTDSAYQQAVSGGKRTLSDYLSEINRRRGEATTQFNQTKSGMETDRAQQLDDLRQEFASRGLINSGLFGQEQGKFQKQFTDQLNALGQQQSGLLSDLLSQQHNYQREYDLALQQAKQEALARRAAQYGIGG